jgi:biopolymer transport protein ExbD
MKNIMKAYLMPKLSRPRLEVNMTLYGHLLALIWVILLAAITPLWIYHIPSMPIQAVSSVKSTLQAPWVILIEGEGEYAIHHGKTKEQFTSLESLKNGLLKIRTASQPAYASVWIKVNSQVNYNHIKPVLSLLQALGVQHIGWVTAS